MREDNNMQKQSLESMVTFVRPFTPYELPKRLHKDYDLKPRYFVSEEELRQIGITSSILSKNTVPGIQYVPEIQGSRKYKVSFRIMAYVDRLATEISANELLS